MTYEYLCPQCGKRFDHEKKMDDPKPPCPDCGSEVKPQISKSGSFHLKGGGWFRDGY